jgi:hypothetical protein
MCALNSEKLNAMLDSFREEQKMKDELFRELIYPRETLIKKTHPASVSDYTEWLKGYLQNGGKPTHSYNYPMSRQAWYVADCDFKILPLYGAEAISIIIPTTVKFLGGVPGHCNLYFMDGFKVEGGIVPIFEDIKF